MSSDLLITSANAIYTITVPGLFNAPFTLKNFAADRAFETEARELAEESMSVDGFLNVGWVANAVSQTISLQASSDEASVFDSIIAAQDQARTIYRLGAVIQLQRRSLDVNFTLKTGGFDPNGEDSLTLSGHRVRAHIANAGMAAGSSLSLRISGMTLSKMNRLSVIRGRQTWQNANTITLYGSENDGAMVAIFSGYITAAFVDFTGAPDVVFQVETNNLSLSAAKAMPVISFGSAVDFETIASAICVSQGWALKNHGVKARHHNDVEKR